MHWFKLAYFIDAVASPLPAFLTVASDAIVISLCLLLQLMCLVGEAFEESSDEVCGAVVQIRGKADKIAIWTANSKKDQDILTIGYVGVHVHVEVGVHVHMEVGVHVHVEVGVV